MSIPISKFFTQRLPHPHFPPLVAIRCLCTSVYQFNPANLFICIIFLVGISMPLYLISVFLFLTDFTLYDSL